MKRRVVFFLPGIANRPIGGYKVVYEYANRLVDDGYIVNIIYPAYMHIESDSSVLRLLRLVKAVFRYLYCLITKSHSCRLWFNLDERVKESVVPSLNEKWCPKSDIYVATSVRTAIYLNKYKKNKQKLYLIQGYEKWGNVTEEKLKETYQFDLRKIVISKWLYKIVSKYDDSVLIPNGFDFTFFKKNVDIEDRCKYNISMMFHEQELKGCNDGFKALDIVKKVFPQLQVALFGVYPKPENLPDWITYYRQPDKITFNNIYNNSAIFIATSHYEGWGLTVGEAMMCGCAVACTDNDGYREMAIDGETALLSPIKNHVALAENIIKLINNDSLRFKIARAGYESIKKFNWETSYKKFKSCIE